MYLDGPKMGWGATYWPIWLFVSVAAFLGPEIYALASGVPSNTLSAWVWRLLKTTRNETVAGWGAASYLSFGLWLVLVTWLTFHFWFGRFT